ncbi:MAG: flagellar assembly protein FliH [Desulfovibrio sp.]|nr:flagellar assembly protein FliH [Desulfovibrio sp.]
MSEQDKNPAAWGTIFLNGSERSLAGLEGSRKTSWNEKDEAVYLERVRTRAENMAAGLVAKARDDAREIREQARREGYAKGLDEAGAELESFRAGMAESVAALLSAIEGQCSHIFARWREDLAEMAKLAVERVTAVELSEKRAQSLKSLLGEAVAVLENRRELVIRVNAEDEPALSDILNLTRELFPDVKSWRVRSDASISPGGLLVESESSLADGRMEKRLAAVDEVLKHLSLADDPDEP